MQGKIFSYIHANGQVGSLVKISAVTDFATRTDVFNEFGKNVAMQIAAMDPFATVELLDQDFIKDPSKRVLDLLLDLRNELKEEVRIVSFQRFSIYG